MLYRWYLSNEIIGEGNIEKRILKYFSIKRLGRKGRCNKKIREGIMSDVEGKLRECGILEIKWGKKKIKEEE